VPVTQPLLKSVIGQIATMLKLDSIGTTSRHDRYSFRSFTWRVSFLKRLKKPAVFLLFYINSLVSIALTHVLLALHIANLPFHFPANNQSSGCIFATDATALCNVKNLTRFPFCKAF
jgi:hypothetical protein